MNYKNIYRVEVAIEEEIKTVRLRCNKGWDSIRITYSDDGLMQIFSSFGNYAYFWGSMGVDTMAEFWTRGSGSEDYYANKLWDHDKPKKYLDSDKFKKEFIEKFDLSEEFDEDIVDDLDNLLSEYGGSRDLFYSNWDGYENLKEYDSHDIYEHDFGMEYKGSYKVLRNEIIPIIIKYFEGTLEKLNEELTLEFPDQEKTA